jgi:hypothetical protein
MRKSLSVAVLVLALCCPVSAGIIHNPAPQPTPTSVVQEPTDDVTLNGIMHNPGEIHTPGEMHTGVSGSLAQVALDLLAILPSIL